METAENEETVLNWLMLAWDDYISGFAVLFPVMLALVALSLPTFWLIHRYNSYLPALPYLLLVLTPATTGSNLVYIKLARGEKTSFMALFSAFQVYPQALAVTVWLGFITMAGMLAFILPGIILYTTYCFSEYAVVDRRTGIKESFRFSSGITPGWRGGLALLLILTTVVDILTPSPVGVAGKLSAPSLAFELTPWIITGFCLKTFVFLPWLHMAMARAYNTLVRCAPPAPVPTADAD